MQDHTIRSYYQLVADTAAKVWDSRHAEFDDWADANDNLTTLLWGDQQTFPGLGEHRQSRDHAGMAYAMHRWTEFIRDRAKLERRAKAAHDGREVRYVDTDGLVVGGKGLGIREFTDLDGARKREVYGKDGALQRQENISHELEVQPGDAIYDPSGALIGGQPDWGGLYSTDPIPGARWAYERQKDSEGFEAESFEDFLERTGIRWNQDTPSPFGEDGALSAKVYVKDTGLLQDAKDVAKTLMGRSDPAGFQLTPEVADLPMFSNDPRVIERDQILSGKLEEDELGRKYVSGANGEPLYIPSLGSGSYTFVGEDGKSHTIDLSKADLQDIRDMHEGDILSGTIIGGLYHSKGMGLFGESDYVDTVYGRMLLPQITGNRDIDEQLMNDPRFLRAALEERSSGWWRGIKAAGRLGISIAEFQAFGPAWRVMGKAGRTLGGRFAARSEFGGMARGFAADTVSAAARVAEGGSVASQPIRKLRFTPSQIGEEILYEALTTYAAGDWERSLEDVVSSGFKEGVLEMMFAAPVRFARRVGGRVLDGFYEGRALRKASDAVARQVEGVTSGAKAGIARDALERNLWNPEFASQVAGAIDSGGTMWLFGVYAAAEEIAAREGKRLTDLDADELLQAALSPEAAGMALTGIGVNLARARKRKGLPLDPDRRRAMNDHIEALARSIEGVDPEGLREALSDIEAMGLQDVAARLQEAFPDKEVPHEGYAPPTALEQIELLWEEKGGPEKALELIQSVETGVLEQLEMDARGLPLMPGPDGTSPRAGLGKAVVEAVNAEQKRRAAGGKPKKRTRPKRRPRKASELSDAELERYTQAEGDAVSVRGMSVVPGDGGYRIVTRADHSKPVKRDAGPYETREAAVRQMLDMSRIFQGDARSRGKEKRLAKHEQVVMDPVAVEPEANAELEDVVDVVEEMARLQAEERLAEQRRLLGRKPDPEGSPVPEPLRVMQAQLEAVQDGRKPAMLVTPGSQAPELPPGMSQREVPEGTLIYPTGSPLPPELGEALGYGTSEQSGPTVVTARDAEGTVIQDVQSPPTERVLDAAAEVAGPEGTVEVRTVPEALAERRGEPSSAEVAAGLNEIVRNLKRTPNYADMPDQAILDELISAETLATSEGLAKAVEASRTMAQEYGVTPARVEPRGGDRATTRRELEHELRQLEPALAEEVSQIHQAVPVPDLGNGSDAPALGPEQDLDAFSRGFEAFRGQGKYGNHANYLDVVQHGIWLRSQIARGGAGAQAELDAMIAGMVLANGGRRSSEGFVAALAGVPAGAVGAVRARLLAAAEPHAHRIESVVEAGLLGQGQLTNPRWGAANRELLLLGTLPYGEADANRRSVGGYPGGSLIADIRRWAKGEIQAEGVWSMEQLSSASGVDADVLSQAIEAQADAVAAGLRKVTQKSQLRDVRAEIAARISSNLKLGSTSMDAKLKDGRTLREATDQAVSLLQGREVSGDRGNVTGAVEINPQWDPVQPDTRPMDAGEQAALWHAHTQSMRVAWDTLGRVNLPSGRPIVPRGTLGASPVARVLLRMLELGDPALRETFRQSTTEGEPTFSDPDAAFEAARARVAESLGFMEKLALRHLGHAGGEETHRIVDAVFEASRQRARRQPVSQDVMATLQAGDPLLFAPGEALEPGAELKMARKLYDVLNQDLEGELADVMDSDMTEYFFANPIQLLFGEANWLDTDEARQTYAAGSIQSVFRGMLDSRKAVDWLDSKLPLGLGELGWSKALAPVRWALRGMGYLQAPVRGVAQPSSVRKAGLSVRESRLSSEYANDVFGAAAKRVVDEIAAKELTLGEREFIGKAILAGAYQRIGSLEEWTRTFGDGAAHLYGIGADVVALFNSIGRSLYETGVLDRQQFEKWAGAYLPRMAKDGLGGEYAGRMRDSHDLFWGGWNGRGFEKKAEGEIDPTDQVFDVAFLLPYGVAAETNRLRLFDQLDRMVKRGDVFLTEEQWMALPPIAKTQWLPALERPGQVYPRMAQRKLAKFIESERQAAEASGFPATERKTEILEAIENGYVTTHTLGELEILLDQTDPSEVSGVGAFLRELDVVWKRNKTLGSPRHWVLDSISSVLTNSMVGRVPMHDFIRSFATGRGYYADAGRGIKLWDQWNESGRPTLEEGDPNKRTIEVIDRLIELQGGTTLQSQLFGGNEARDLFDAMTVGGVLESNGTTAQLFEAVTKTLGGSATSKAALQSRIDRLASAIDPNTRALAIQELMNHYQALQMWPKVAAALRGMDRGMKLEEAAFWGAEGTGDYADRSPWLYRLTTQFTSPMTGRTRAILEEEPSRTKRVAMRLPRWTRTWWGTPFLMYRAAMIPALSRAMLNNTLGAAAGVAGVVLATRGMSSEDDERDLLFSDPRIDKKAMERFLANQEEGLRLPIVGDLQTKASNLKLYLDAAADSALYLFTAGNRGEYRPAEAGMLMRAAQGSQTGRSEYLAMGEYVGGNLPGLAADAAEMLADTMGLNGEKPIFTDPAEAYQMQGIGLLPTMAMAGIAEVVGLGRAAVQGEKGESLRGEAPIKRMITMALDAMAEIGSPITGASPLMSSDGQRLMRTVLAEGRSMGEILDGMPRPALERMAVGEKVQGFASTFLLPRRSVRTTSLIPERQSMLEQRIRTMERLMSFEAGASDKASERWDMATEGLRKFLTTSVKDAYVEAREGPMSVPVDAVFHGYWTGLADDLIRGANGTVVVKARPSSVLGRFIANQPEELQDTYIKVATEFMHTTSFDLARIFMPIARQGNASPEFMSTLTEGIYNQAADLDPGALMKKVAAARDRWDDLNLEDRMRWFSVFRMMNVAPSDFSSAKYQEMARELHQHFADYFEQSRGTQVRALDDVGAMGAEMFPGNAAAEFSELFGVK